MATLNNAVELKIRYRAEQIEVHWLNGQPAGDQVGSISAKPITGRQPERLDVRLRRNSMSFVAVTAERTEGYIRNLASHNGIYNVSTFNRTLGSLRIDFHGR